MKAKVHTPGLSTAVATCIRLWVSLSLHLLAIKLEEFRQVHLLSFNETDMKIQIIEQSDRNEYKAKYFWAYVYLVLLILTIITVDRLSNDQ